MSANAGKQRADKTVRICARSNPTELPRIRQAVRTAAVQAGFDDDQAAQLILAVDEAFANVIKHGYEGRRDQPVEVSLACMEERGNKGVFWWVGKEGYPLPTISIVADASVFGWRQLYSAISY